MYSPIKERLLRWLEPYREERASYMLEWRIFAQAHNAAGKLPMCWYSGMELPMMDKVALQDEEETDPDCLRKAHSHMREAYRPRQ